jgi:ATP-dependent DNA helicase RecG
MREADVLRLIRGGERIDVEFKSDSRRALSDDDLVSAAVCMANLPASYDRGWVVVGVEDDGKVTGCHAKRERPLRPHLLESMIRSRTTPPIHVTAFTTVIDEADVVVLELRRSEHLHSRTDGLTIRREMGVGGPECVPVSASEAAAHRFRVGRDDYTAEIASGVTIEDLDPLAIERLRSMLRLVGDEERAALESTMDLLRSMELAVTIRDETSPTIAALLLLGREQVLRRVLPTHEVWFQVF